MSEESVNVDTNTSECVAWLSTTEWVDVGVDRVAIEEYLRYNAAGAGHSKPK